MLKSHVWKDLRIAKENDLIKTGIVIGLEQYEKNELNLEKFHITKATDKEFYSDSKFIDTLKVDFHGIPGYLPKHLIYRIQISDSYKRMRNLVGQEIKLMILRVEKESDFVLTSNIDAVEIIQDDVFSEIKTGQIIACKVKSLTPHRAILDFEGLDITLSKKEVERGFIKSVTDYIQKDEIIQVKIMNIDKKTGRIEVSRKETLVNKWDNIEKYYRVGSEYLAEVTGIADYGIFACFEPSVSTLFLHPSLPEIRDQIEVGTKVLLRIKEIDVETKKIKSRLCRVI